MVILAIAFAKKLEVEELWVAFGVGKHLRYLPIHKIASSLTTQQRQGLPFFHALTGCDTVSLFSGKGKKTAFQQWRSYPEATELFRALSLPKTILSEQQFRVLERFVVIMYSRTSPHQDVNHARQSMFSQGTRSIESIPPTQAAFEQHVKRAAFQAGHVWGRTLHPLQELPSATDWGWNLSSDKAEVSYDAGLFNCARFYSSSRDHSFLYLLLNVAVVIYYRCNESKTCFGDR